MPCDIGSSPSELEKIPEFTGLDFSPLTPDWTSKAGEYSSEIPALQARARYVRKFLRSRKENTIVLVAHGDILRYIVFGENAVSPWSNAEVRKYRFKSEGEEDDEAWLELIKTEEKEGGEGPTSSQATQGQSGKVANQ